MKNIKYLLLIVTFAFAATSCDTYDDYDSDRAPVVGFTRTNVNINGIGAGTSKSTTVDVYASDISPNDRTFNVISIPIEDSDAFPPTDSENYSFDQTVTIPANENIGTMTVTGTNISLEPTRTYFRLSVESSDAVVGGNRITIGLRP